MEKLTKEQINKLKPYWQKAKILQSQFFTKIAKLEEQASKELKIKDTTLEIFFCDGDMAGIGDYSRKYKLISAEELNKN